MKSLLGLKAKAGQAVKERVDQAKARASALQKPFDSPDGASEGVAKPSSQGPVRASEPHLKSVSPEKKEEAFQNPEDRHEAVDPVISHLLQKARSEAVREEFLKQSAAEYTTWHNIRLLAGTYNVNGRLPPANLDLRPWLDVGGHQPDIVAVAFEEIVPLNAQNVVMGASLEAAGAWDKLIEAALNGPSERSEGHLVARSQSLAHPGPAGVAGSQAVPAQGSSADGGPPAVSEAEGADAAEDEQGEADDLEGYLSPAEDTFSIFSDDNMAGPKPYTQLAGKQMVGIYLSIWVKRALLQHTRGVQVTSIGTGIMGYLGNKGAVAARLRIFDTGLAFIASHLSSGEQEGDELKRNYDYSEIVRRGAFPPDAPTLEHDKVAPDMPQQSGMDGRIATSGRVPGQWGHLKGLLESEQVIWMGDLNYRLSMPDQEARAAIKAGKLSEVAEWDELQNMISQKRAFQGWQEGPLNFPPTFKFKRGTDIYLGDGEVDQEEAPELSGASISSTAPSVTSSSPNGQATGKAEGTEKRRTPAWTDRILWRPNERLRQSIYRSAPLHVSDHKPVVAAFVLEAREYLRNKVEAAIDTARRIVDAREMAAMPRCELDPLAVEAGTVFYAREKQMHLILSNRGVVGAQWQFMHLPGVMFGDAADQVSRPAPRWASVEPLQGVLKPGEACEVQLSIRVDGGKASTAELLANTAERKLDAILVLRVQDGNDVFCSVTGAFAPSFFGLPLALLSTLPRPLIPAAGQWSSGSPKLQINTQKKQHRRDALGSDGPPGDFYSPMSSFPDSPPSAATLDPEAGRFRQRGRTFSVGSDLDSDPAFAGRSAADQAEPSSPEQSQTAPLPAGLSSVDEIAEAFGTARLAQPDQSSAAATAEESHPHASGLYKQDSTSIAALLPPELRELTEYLYEGERLKTPGLFLSSVDLAHAASPRSPSNTLKTEESEVVTAVRESLDRGLGVPSSATPQDVAATILAFFCALPQPFMPHAAAQVCDICSPSRSANVSLLADALSPAEWAIFRHMTGLLRDVLDPQNAGDNGLTKESLANLFAEVWFERMPLDFRVASHDLKPVDVANLQRLADGVAQVGERRSAFIASFLEPLEE